MEVRRLVVDGNIIGCYPGECFYCYEFKGGSEVVFLCDHEDYPTVPGELPVVPEPKNGGCDFPEGCPLEKIVETSGLITEITPEELEQMEKMAIEIMEDDPNLDWPHKMLALIRWGRKETKELQGAKVEIERLERSIKYHLNSYDLH